MTSGVDFVPVNIGLAYLFSANEVSQDTFGNRGPSPGPSAVGHHGHGGPKPGISAVGHGGPKPGTSAVGHGGPKPGTSAVGHRGPKPGPSSFSGLLCVHVNGICLSSNLHHCHCQYSDEGMRPSVAIHIVMKG